ncbi:MAG: 1-acyl-sn-glycerol-3-phosphate acyltransferase [Dehalococcoidales bacterium]|nr:1-acyl-sn-glycerol-3-phosphate acyltransferase [Dehalococcoidales bacterium]
MLFRLLTRCQVNGRENVPSDGPLLVVANHLSLADVPLLGISFERRLVFMAKVNLFRYPLVSSLMRLYASIPLRRGKADREALRRAIQWLTDGQVLAMFPEGTRSRTGQLGHAFPGSALIASHSGATVLPVGISGTERISRLAWRLCRPRITVNIGSPLHLPPASGKLTKAELAARTELIMERIAELLPSEYRGSTPVRKT